jgi:hypothetical protein
MVVLVGNFAVGCGPGTDYTSIHIFSMYATTKEVLELITFVLAYPTVYIQGDQKVSVHLIITVHKTRNNILNSFNHLPL